MMQQPGIMSSVVVFGGDLKMKNKKSVDDLDMEKRVPSNDLFKSRNRRKEAAQRVLLVIFILSLVACMLLQQIGYASSLSNLVLQLLGR